MNTVNLKMKTKKKTLFKKRTLHENILYIYISKALYSFSFKNLSLFKAELKKYFCPSFPESKIHLSYASYAHLFQVLKHTFKYRL